MAGGYQAQPDDDGALSAQLLALRRRLDALESGLKRVGLHIDGATGNLIIDANALLTADFDGVLSPPAAGNNGVAISNGKIIANAAVFKDLLIDNDALTSPVSVAAGSDSADTFALTTTSTTRAQVDLPVPAGFSQALAFCVANVTGSNSTASSDSVDVGVWINGVSVGGLQAIQQTAPSTTGGATRGGSRLLTGLSGGNVTFQSRVRTGVAGWASFAGNSTNIDAIAVFLR